MQKKPRFFLDSATLTPITPNDLGDLCELLWQPPVRKFLCDDVQLELATIETFINNSSELDTNGLGLWKIHKGPEFLGIVGLRPVDEELSLSFSEAHPLETIVAITSKVWGQGLAGKALFEIHRYALDSLNLKTVYAVIDFQNVRSKKLFEAIGYVQMTHAQSNQHAVAYYEKSLV